MTFSPDPQSIEAIELVSRLQDYFVMGLSKLSYDYGNNEGFKKVTWLRDEGEHGGGIRYEAADEVLFNRASVNISQVHYHEDENKKLEAASAISTIIHPNHPRLPSIHMHISWTQMKAGKGYWRMMADLNPSVKDEALKLRFSKMLQDFNPDLYETGSGQGNRYFYIPALKCHRGVSHYYLEEYHSGSFESDKAMAERLGISVIDTYLAILQERLAEKLPLEAQDKQTQLEYHTLYLFQVLTLDRGTTSGLLIHDQNDIGIMGSIPRYISRELLSSWVPLIEEAQKGLLEAIIETLGDKPVIEVDETLKKALAERIRRFYKEHPEALKYQASGFTVPTTVENHTK